MDFEEPKNESPTPEIRIEIDRLVAVGNALAAGDIAECRTGDVKHTVELLAHVVFLENLAPGLLSNMLSVLIPLYIRRLNTESGLRAAEEFADERGLGDEFRAFKAANDRRKRTDRNSDGEYVRASVALFMKANGWTQAEAIRLYAEHYGRDEESVRRTVTRQKKRAKK